MTPSPEPPSTSTTTSTITPLPQTLNLLTLNCWGLRFISALRTPRLAEIGRQIAALDPVPDIVCLQECWAQDDYRAIRDATAAALPHGKSYHGGAFGAGLAILSRWPLESSSMSPYPLNGRPTAFWRGDWYVGKGVASALIRFGPGGKDVVEVFNTHTHAPYLHGKSNSYTCHRTSQAWHLSKLLRAASDRNHLVLALGDFNMLPGSLPHRILASRAPVADVWRALHPDSALGPANHPDERARGVHVPSAEFNLRVNGATSDSVFNTWRWTKKQQNRLRAGMRVSVDPDTEDLRGKRLDYIFASTGLVAPYSSSSSSPSSSPSSSTSPSSPTPTSPHQSWIVKSASVALTDPHPTLHVSLSDHFAVQATLQLHIPSTSNKASERIGRSTTTSNGTSSGNGTQSNHLTLSDYDEILAQIHQCTARELKQRSWRGLHFFAAVAVWIACLVAVWFSPANFVAVILLLFGSLNLVAGVVDGLIALLFFSWELRNLKEYEWDVQNARAAASKGDNAEKPTQIRY